MKSWNTYFERKLYRVESIAALQGQILYRFVKISRGIVANETFLRWNQTRRELFKTESWPTRISTYTNFLSARLAFQLYLTSDYWTYYYASNKSRESNTWKQIQIIFLRNWEYLFFYGLEINKTCSALSLFALHSLTTLLLF